VQHVRSAFWCNFLMKSAKRRCEIFIFAEFKAHNSLSVVVLVLGLAKLGNIVADANVSQFSRAGNVLRKQILLLGSKKCFCLESKTFFFFPVTNFASETYVSQFIATPGNITRNIVSATFPSLARPQETTTAMTTTTSQIRSMIG